MRRFLKLLIVVNFLIFSIALSAKSTASPGSEIGDAVFRPIIWPLLQHTGIYRNSDSRSITADWDPSEDMLNSDIQHSVIQSSGSGEVVNIYSKYSKYLLNTKYLLGACLLTIFQPSLQLPELF